MAAKLLEGKVIAAGIRDGLRKEVDLLSKRFGRPPLLATIQVGGSAASALYLKSQKANAGKLGIAFQHHRLDEKIQKGGLIDYIKRLNNDKEVSGILLQLPLPEHLNPGEISACIDPAKDAEGMHPQNIGTVVFGRTNLVPCTAMAVMELIRASGIELYGKEAVVVGHSEICGKPVGLLLVNKLATVTTCHIGTGERGALGEHVKRAEVLVVAVGKAGLIKGEWIRDGAVVVDVGINRVNGRVTGDVEFEEAARRASFITPVPGGVGPLTVTMLMRNVVEAFKAQAS